MTQKITSDLITRAIDRIEDWVEAIMGFTKNLECEDTRGEEKEDYPSTPCEKFHQAIYLACYHLRRDLRLRNE